nr:hypothetical protein [Sutterella parvirubra]
MPTPLLMRTVSADPISTITGTARIAKATRFMTAGSSLRPKYSGLRPTI